MKCAFHFVMLKYKTKVSFKLLIPVGHPEWVAQILRTVTRLQVWLHSQSNQFLMEIHHTTEVKWVSESHFMLTLNNTVMLCDS